jgi:hypothetical protein
MASAPGNSVQNYPLIENATTTFTGLTRVGLPAVRTFTAGVTGTGSVSATVVIEVSAVNGLWSTFRTITLSGTTSAVDGFYANAPWPFVRARVTAISGTGATVNVAVGA